MQVAYHLHFKIGWSTVCEDRTRNSFLFLPFGNPFGTEISRNFLRNSVCPWEIAHFTVLWLLTWLRLFKERITLSSG